MEDPLSLIDISVIGTKNILNLCLKYNTRILLQVQVKFTEKTAIYRKEDDDRVLGNPVSTDGVTQLVRL